MAQRRTSNGKKDAPKQTSTPKQQQSSPSWAYSGQKGKDRALAEKERREKEFGPPNFYLSAKDGLPASAKIVVLDDIKELCEEGKTIGFFYQHTIHMGGNRYDGYTCLADVDSRGCPYCESGSKASLVHPFTIIDNRDTAMRDGHRVKYVRKVMICKADAYNAWQTQMELKGTLRLGVFLVKRSRQKEVNTGSDVNFDKRITEEALMKVRPASERAETYLQPYDYAEIFKPLSYEEAQRVVGQAPAVGSDNEFGNDGFEEVPNNNNTGGGDFGGEDPFEEI